MLINNAGLYYEKAIMDMSEADFDEMMNINIKAAYFMAKEVAIQMKKQQAKSIHVERAIDYIYENYSKNISVTDIAEYLGIATSSYQDNLFGEAIQSIYEKLRIQVSDLSRDFKEVNSQYTDARKSQLHLNLKFLEKL